MFCLGRNGHEKYVENSWLHQEFPFRRPRPAGCPLQNSQVDTPSDWRSDPPIRSERREAEVLSKMKFGKESVFESRGAKMF